MAKFAVTIVALGLVAFASSEPAIGGSTGLHLGGPKIGGALGGLGGLKPHHHIFDDVMNGGAASGIEGHGIGLRGHMDGEGAGHLKAERNLAAKGHGGAHFGGSGSVGTLLNHVGGAGDAAAGGIGNIGPFKLPHGIVGGHAGMHGGIKYHGYGIKAKTNAKAIAYGR